MAILNKIQVKGVLYEIEDSNAIHGTLKTVNGESLHGTGDVVTVGKATEQNGEIFNDYENNVANGTYSSAIGNSTVANNFAENASGQFNVSNSGAEGKNNTLSSVGIGTSDDARKNAFEIMRNGDLYVYGIGEYNGTNPIQTNSLQTIINQSLADIESKVDKSTTVNGKPLSSNVVINGTDIIVGGDSDYRTDSLAEAFKKVDDFIGDAQSYAVTSFGGQTGDVTIQINSETNGDVNFTMFNKELRGTVVGLKSAAYTEAQDYATAAQGLKADSAVQSVRESNTGTNISILASKTGNVINLTPSLTTSTVSSNGTGLTTASDVKSYVDTSINNLDKTAVTAKTGQVISSVSQTNGIVSASVKTLAEADIPTLSQSKISGLSTALNAKQDASVSTLPTTSKTISGAISEIFDDLSSHVSNKSNPHSVTKAQIGLGNVDNTSDANKPISTATQNALNTLTTTVNGKQNTITGAASTVTTNNLTANRALVSNASGKIAISAVTSTELGYLDGVTSNIQTQLNNKANASALSSYALKDGSNASGTWPISISGNAGTVGGYTAEQVARTMFYLPRVRLADVGWYRVFAVGSNISDARGINILLHLSRVFNVYDNEAYTFSIAVAYNGGISITQLAGRANTRLVDKIRVVYEPNVRGVLYVDFHIGISTAGNDYIVSGQGPGTFQTPAAVTETPANSVEFDTVNGMGSNLGFTGNLTGNATTATNATYANRADYLFSEYTGSGGTQPPSYFKGKGLKVNMMSKPVVYSDVIVVNGYKGVGIDVPYINAIGFQKTAGDHGEVYHARGDYSGDAWGTWYKFLDEYNYTNYTVTKTGSGASGT